MKQLRIFAQLLTIALCSAFFAAAANSATSCSDASRIDNRGIEKVAFKKNAKGEIIVQAKTTLALGQSSERGANLSFDIYASVNGVPSGYVPEDIYFSGAITCAVTCSGKCPSIFGDGICANCNCNYSNWISLPMVGLRDGDHIELKIRPARGGKKEVNERDDVIRVVFNVADLS